MARLQMLMTGVLLVASVVGCGRKPSLMPLAVGRPAPSFRLVSVADGQVIRSDILEGEVAVVNFWSTTCSNCMQEIDDLKEIHASGRAQVIGIALDEDA